MLALSCTWLAAIAALIGRAARQRGVLGPFEMARPSHHVAIPARNEAPTRRGSHSLPQWKRRVYE